MVVTNIKLKHLEIILSQLMPHPKPKLKLEEYTIDSQSATRLLYIAEYVNRDLCNKRVIDLGCGTGRLAIGAKLLGAELILFQAFLTPTLGVAYEGVSVSPTEFKEREEEIRASAMAYLDSLGKRFQEKGLGTSSVVRLGSAADQILEYAEANAVNVIVMSTHGRSGIGRWVLGSVTDKVLHAGDMPVLTVRATRV